LSTAEEIQIHNSRFITKNISKINGYAEDVLYANGGTKLCDEVDHIIGIADLRGTHKGGERVTDSIRRLM
jgi:hypothetical protein